MEQLAANPTKIATKWALFYVGVSIVITYAIDLLNLDPNSAIKYISYLPFIAFCVLTQKEFRDQLGGFLTFGQGFKAGFRYALFAGFLLAIFTLVYLKVLNTGALDKMIEQQQVILAEKNMPQEQIDAATEVTKKWGVLIGTLGAAIGTLISGCIVSLIGAAILKKERSPFDVPDTYEGTTV
ncbi:hypothetical protein A0256_18255 [Mucilaginibacter sp. PAMC 26640]|nr:hypothetical protein A0256_18255 [Mucilaginibacter sp. PAMC 26640]